jgi:hypothetical protein
MFDLYVDLLAEYVGDAGGTRMPREPFVLLIDILLRCGTRGVLSPLD